MILALLVALLACAEWDWRPVIPDGGSWIKLAEPDERIRPPARVSGGPDAGAPAGGFVLE